MLPISLLQYRLPPSFTCLCQYIRGVGNPDALQVRVRLKLDENLQSCRWSACPELKVLIGLNCSVDIMKVHLVTWSLFSQSDSDPYVRSQSLGVLKIGQILDQLQFG